MAKNRTLLFAVVIVAALIVLLLANSSGKPSSDFPQEVRDAIKNKQDVVEIPVSTDITKVFFIDYAGDTHATTLGTDCGPDASDYKFIRKGIKWPTTPVNYQIDTTGFSGVDQASAKQAIVNSFNTWNAEQHPTPAGLYVEGPSAKVLVKAGFIDGPGNTLAVTSISFTASGQILSATTTFDSGDSWTVLPAGVICAAQGASFDIQDIGTHEIGHVGGLDHVRRQVDIAETMWPYAGQGETFKRTLATGDKKGIAALYPVSA